MAGNQLQDIANLIVNVEGTDQSVSDLQEVMQAVDGVTNRIKVLNSALSSISSSISGINNILSAVNDLGKSFDALNLQKVIDINSTIITLSGSYGTLGGSIAKARAELESLNASSVYSRETIGKILSTTAYSKGTMYNSGFQGAEYLKMLTSRGYDTEGANRVTSALSNFSSSQGSLIGKSPEELMRKVIAKSAQGENVGLTPGDIAQWSKSGTPGFESTISASKSKTIYEEALKKKQENVGLAMEPFAVSVNKFGTAVQNFLAANPKVEGFAGAAGGALDIGGKLIGGASSIALLNLLTKGGLWKLAGRAATPAAEAATLAAEAATPAAGAATPAAGAAASFAAAAWPYLLEAAAGTGIAYAAANWIPGSGRSTHAINDDTAAMQTKYGKVNAEFIKQHPGYYMDENGILQRDKKDGSDTVRGKNSPNDEWLNKYQSFLVPIQTKTIDVEQKLAMLRKTGLSDYGEQQILIKERLPLLEEQLGIEQKALDLMVKTGSKTPEELNVQKSITNELKQQVLAMQLTTLEAKKSPLYVGKEALYDPTLATIEGTTQDIKQKHDLMRKLLVLSEDQVEKMKKAIPGILQKMRGTTKDENEISRKKDQLIAEVTAKEVGNRELGKQANMMEPEFVDGMSGIKFNRMRELFNLELERARILPTAASTMINLNKENVRQLAAQAEEYRKLMTFAKGEAQQQEAKVKYMQKKNEVLSAYMDMVGGIKGMLEQGMDELSTSNSSLPGFYKINNFEIGSMVRNSGLPKKIIDTFGSSVLFGGTGEGIDPWKRSTNNMMGVPITARNARNDPSANIGNGSRSKPIYVSIVNSKDVTDAMGRGIQ